MKATGLLMDEHKAILRALNVLDEMAAAAEAGETLDEGDVEEILRFLRLFADHHHQGKEEAVLFPAMRESATCGRYETLRQMIFEHDQERSLVEGMEESLRTRKGKDFAYYARRLNQILRTHMYKEDRILFELADQGLTQEEDARVAYDLAHYEPPGVEETIHELLRRLTALEWKYLRKTA